jgi:hypothetical protein
MSRDGTASLARYRDRGVDHPGDRHSVAGRTGSAAALPQLDPGWSAVSGFAALDVLGDEHVAVEDPDQVIRGDRLDRLPDQHDRHPVAEPAE